MKMSKRKKGILKAIVNEYILTAEPVGSRTLARKYNFGVSPATIRNEMSDLEMHNYLAQPHKSAGRVPTDKGYRFYVDSLISFKELSESKTKLIEEKYRAKKNEVKKLVQQTSVMLSELTKYTSLVLSPQLKRSVFEHLELISLASNKVLLILVTDTGLIKDKIIEFPDNLSNEELENISWFLNQRLNGLALDKIDDQLLDKLNRELMARFDFVSDKLKLLSQEVFSNNGMSNEDIYLGGTTYILDQPEFNDIKKVKSLLKLLEQEKQLHNILKTIDSKKSNDSDSSQINVAIGSELPHKAIDNCSVVIATYHLNGRPVGKIGVLGPTRMKYDEVISSVKFMSDFLSDLLTNN